MEELISVIIPAYNAQKHIDKCLKSLYEQTYKNLEIIIIDDNSTDRTAEIVKEWAGKDDRIAVIHNEKNAGHALVRNPGLDVANGKYIGFVDSDDYIHPEFFARMKYLIDEYDTDSDIIYTNIINENYVTDFDEIELKINTAAENKPISRSYIMNTSNNYIVNLTKNGVTKRQEHNLVNMYYDHYYTKKKIYECTIHDFLNPGSPVETTATDGFFIIDT